MVPGPFASDRGTGRDRKRRAIQLGIRLLIPEGSRTLELEDVRQLIEPFDPQSLAYPGKAPTRGSTLQ